MERNDIHRPSVINPSEYTFVCFDYLGGSDLGALLMLKQHHEIYAAHEARTGGKQSNHEHGGTCYVCGARASYLTVWYHEFSNTYIQTGEDCAQKMDMSYDESDMNYFRKQVRTALEAVAGKSKAEAVLTEAKLDRCWDMYTNVDNYLTKATSFERPYLKAEEHTITDIVGKLVRYGSISDKQISFLHSLLNRIDNRAVNRAVIEGQRAAAQEAAAPCPTGRMVVEGIILGMKTTETNWGPETRILVQHETGYKVWGTRIACFEKGERVRFTATVEPSKDDIKFGFFKRPTKPERFVDGEWKDARINSDF